MRESCRKMLMKRRKTTENLAKLLLTTHIVNASSRHSSLPSLGAAPAQLLRLSERAVMEIPRIGDGGPNRAEVAANYL